MLVSSPYTAKIRHSFILRNRFSLIRGGEIPTLRGESATETTSRHLARRLARPWEGWGNTLDYGHNILQTAGR